MWAHHVSFATMFCGGLSRLPFLFFYGYTSCSDCMIAAVTFFNFESTF